MLKIKVENAIFKMRKCNTHSRTLSVDGYSVTYSPGPMMVYALTLNVTTVLVLGGRGDLSVCAVWLMCWLLERISYTMMTLLDFEGGVHETVNCTIPEVVCKQDTGLGTVYMCTSVNQACMYSYKQYHFHTVTMPCIYF